MNVEVQNCVTQNWLMNWKEKKISPNKGHHCPYCDKEFAFSYSLANRTFVDSLGTGFVCYRVTQSHYFRSAISAATGWAFFWLICAVNGKLGGKNYFYFSKVIVAVIINTNQTWGDYLSCSVILHTNGQPMFFFISFSDHRKLSETFLFVLACEKYHIIMMWPFCVLESSTHPRWPSVTRITLVNGAHFALHNNFINVESSRKSKWMRLGRIIIVINVQLLDWCAAFSHLTLHGLTFRFELLDVEMFAQQQTAPTMTVILQIDQIIQMYVFRVSDPLHCNQPIIGCHCLCKQLIGQVISKICEWMEMWRCSKAVGNVYTSQLSLLFPFISYNFADFYSIYSSNLTFFLSAFISIKWAIRCRVLNDNTKHVYSQMVKSCIKLNE